MGPHRQWNFWVDAATANRRAGGRRRYNAARQRKADERRAAMAQALEKMGPAAMFFDRGLSIAFARAFGVHRSTAWRDLQVILGPGRNYHFTCGDKELFTITRAYGGGPVLSVTDPEGQEIRGDQRRAVLRRLPRYFGR